MMLASTSARTYTHLFQGTLVQLWIDVLSTCSIVCGFGARHGDHAQ